MVYVGGTHALLAAYLYLRRIDGTSYTDVVNSIMPPEFLGRNDSKEGLVVRQQRARLVARCRLLLTLVCFVLVT